VGFAQPASDLCSARKDRNLPKVIKPKRARDARIEALQLLGQWTTLGQSHVLLGGGCSCGIAAGSLAVGDFEQQIVDFLRNKYASAGNDAAARVVRESASLGALLRAIAANPRSEALTVLTDLKRTLDSFDEIHRSR
jgi:hypothetical protein